MKLPKYTVCKVSKHSGMFWAVFKGRKEISVHKHQDEAMSEAQRMVEDDRWHEANRD